MPVLPGSTRKRASVWSGSAVLLFREWPRQRTSPEGVKSRAGKAIAAAGGGRDEVRAGYNGLSAACTKPRTKVGSQHNFGRESRAGGGMFFDEAEGCGVGAGKDDETGGLGRLGGNPGPRNEIKEHPRSV